MSTAAVAVSCPFCEQSLETANAACPNCRASVDWIDAARAVEFAQRRFEQWNKEGKLHDIQLRAIDTFYCRMRDEMKQAALVGKDVPADIRVPSADQCWSCKKARSSRAQSYCSTCGASLDSAGVRSLRYLEFLARELKFHEESSRLRLMQTHDFLMEARERIAALRSRLEKERLPEVTAITATPTPQREEPNSVAGMSTEPPPAAPEEVAEPPAPAMPRRSLWEILLDPRSIQWLLVFGGVLLVLGLVIWLWTQHFFERPEVIATALGIGNVALLLGGWGVIRGTRYQTAGRALTLLACLVMPLNLWFYHANHLITLEGNLWLAGLVCCVFYAGSALVLRDPVFVYVLEAGVAMTGLLILAQMNKFGEIAAPCTLLVVLGILSLAAERAFPEGEDGPFTRRRFGLAFFWSGHALLAGGLLLLLGGQISGLLHPLLPLTDIVSDVHQKWLALGLVLTGIAAYLYSDIVVRRVGVYVYLAVFALLWAEILVIDLFRLELGKEVIITALALTALAANVGQSLLVSEPKLNRAGPPLGLFLCSAPVIYGLLLHLRATNLALNAEWPYTVNWGYVGAMLATAISCRVGAYLYRHTIPWLSMIYFFGTAASTLVGAAGILALLHLNWAQQAPWLMLIPVLYLAAARLYQGHTAEQPLVWVAHTATGIMIVSVLAAALHITQQVVEPITGQQTNLLLAWFLAEAAVFYGLAAGLRQRGINIYLCTAAACGSVWQLLCYAGTPTEYFTLAFAVLGLVMLIAYRLTIIDRFPARLGQAAFECANALMSLSFVAAGLLTLSRLLVSISERHPLGDTHWQDPLRMLRTLLIALGGLSLLAAWLVRHHAWRRWYIVTAILHGLLVVLVLHRISNLSPWQKLEIGSVILGLLLLVVGHVGWYREQERHNDLVSLSLFLGSVLLALPLAIAVVVHRSVPEFFAPDEVGFFLCGVILLGTGFMFQIRSTTLVGVTSLMLYLLTMVMFARRALEQVQTAALLMAVGGGLIFILGLVLSIYRDRLLTLPDRIKRREGVFRVLGWR